MSGDPSDLRAYFNPLSADDRRALEERSEQYRDQLEARGYQVTIAEGEHGLFAGVLVIDEAEDRYGFLEEDGSVTWLGEGLGGIGALGTAVAQNPTRAFQQKMEELEDSDLE